MHVKISEITVLNINSQKFKFFYLPAPGCLGGEVSVMAFCLCNVDGRSLRRSEVVLLKGDES